MQHPSPSTTFIPVTAASAAAAQWDAERGEWIGRRALADEEALELPSPLYIFGYGSLMFKPEESFADCERIDGWVYGWKRVWAQRSCDHRGVPHQPGIVCTVLSDDELAELGLRGGGDAPSVTHGVAYRIPDDQVHSVLDELDVREKGGYMRAVVEVHHSGTGEVVRALLYTGSAKNPNFQYLEHDVAAHVIAWSNGPSGENIEYFLNVHEYLERAGAGCAETFKLVDLVREVRTLGLDRRPLLDPRHQPKWRPVPLHGWGSNERGQLGIATAADAVANEEFDFPGRTLIEVDARKGWGGTVRQLAAGGVHSALLGDDGHLFLWGGNEAGQLGTGGTPGRVLVNGLDQVHPFPRRVAMVALGHAHTLVLEQGTGRVFGVGANGAGEATGRRSPDVASCREEGGGLVQPVEGEDGGYVRMAFIAAGVRHSAGVTVDGALMTWGSRTHGEGLPPGIGPWRPADGAALVSVACGWRHTVALDARGRVYTLGANKYGQRGLWEEGEGAAGSDPLPQRVPLAGGGEAATAVAVDEVVCGWSHSLARTRDGQVYGWGRNDFGQLGLGPDAPARVAAPVRLPLPEGAAPVRSIAAGSEFSVVVGADGDVYTCGWNEHGNLGVGGRENTLGWLRVPVPEAVKALARQGQLLVACGGAHVLTLARDQTWQ